MASYLEIAAKVLLASRVPLSAREILERAYLENLVPKHLYGKTQHKTLQARLSEDILSKRDRSLFFRTDPGRFFLKRFVSDSSIPEELKTEFPARRRARDLHYTGILALEKSDLSRSNNAQFSIVDTEQVFNLLKGNKYRYSTSREEYKARNCALIFSFVVVCRNNHFLSYRPT
jgi:hypothetical protein